MFVRPVRLFLGSFACLRYVKMNFRVQMVIIFEANKANKVS